MCLKSGHGVNLTADAESGRLQTAERMNLSVIEHAVRLCLHFNRVACLTVGNAQPSLSEGDIVVGCACSFIEFIGEGIAAETGEAPAAGHREGCAFAFRKALSADCDTVCLQFITAVLRLGIRGHKDQISLLNFQCAVLHHQHELGRYIIALTVGHLRRSADRDRIDPGMNSGRMRLNALDMVFIVSDPEAVLHGIDGLFTAVVLCLQASGCQDHFIFRIAASDMQRAGIRNDVVIIRIRAFIQRICECIRRAADNRLAAGHFKRSAFPIHKSASGNRYIRTSQRFAVVFL